VTVLEYRFTNDVLFKTLFVKYPELLKRLVANMLDINLVNIGRFAITNPDTPPEVVGEKFCRLDISMTVDGQRVDLEVQVVNEGDYPERSLYYWAREYSSALQEGGEYSDLPRTIVISILAFKQFDCVEYYSEYQALEITRYSLLSDKFCLKFYELPKLPKVDSAEDELKLWLTLFNAKTEEDLLNIEAIGGTVMKQAIGAYRQVTATDEFKEIERLRSRARHNEASALGKARREGRAEADEKWQVVIADKDAAIADKDAAIADKDVAIADKDAQIAALLARLNENSS
jgi:predicted transposase/invertase (TIGR01784 family)